METVAPIIIFINVSWFFEKSQNLILTKK